MITRFSTALEPDLLAAFDKFIACCGYKNRSEAIRDIIRKEILEGYWKSGSGEVVGVISLVYRHRQHKLQCQLTELQHQDHALVISATHVHLDHDNCLEVILVRGAARRVKAMANRLISARGVKRGTLSAMLAGAQLS